MKRNKLQSSKARQSLTSAIIVGVVIALLLSVALSALVTNFVLNGRLNEVSVSTIILLIRTVSVLIGALVGGVRLKEKYLLQVAITTLSYILMLLGVGIVFYDGISRRFLGGCVSALIGGVMALFVLQRSNNKKYSAIKFSQ